MLILRHNNKTSSFNAQVIRKVLSYYSASIFMFEGCASVVPPIYTCGQTRELLDQSTHSLYLNVNHKKLLIHRSKVPA